MNLTNEKLQITRAELAAFCAHASADQTRQALASVCIDLGAARVSATDGHRLLCWTAEKCGDRQVLLPSHGLRQVLALREPKKLRPLGARQRNAVKPPPATLDFEFGPKETRVTVGELAVVLKHVDATFPAVEHVIPKYARGAPTACVGVNPSFFADIARVAKTVSPSWPSVVIQPGPGELDAILVRFESPEWLAVLMPSRASSAYDAPAIASAKKKRVA